MLLRLDRHDRRGSTRRGTLPRSTRDVFEDDFFMRPLQSMLSRGFGFGRSSFFDDDPFFSSPLESMMAGASISSSSVRTRSGSGGNGVYYSSTTTMTSANGVTETTHAVEDSRTGTQKVAVKRSLGDKSTTVEKVRDREGREQTTKKLENVTEQEEDQFDAEWQDKSSRLPSWGRHHLDATNSLMSSSRNHGPRAIDAGSRKRSSSKTH